MKGCHDFPHANQETNNAVESYHCYLKTNFLSDRWKKCACGMDWLLYVLLTNVEPVYQFGEILKEEGYLKNYRKEKQLESSMERAKRIPDSDCCPHESISHAYWVRSQTNPHKKYPFTWYRVDVSMHTCVLTCSTDACIGVAVCRGCSKVDT